VLEEVERDRPIALGAFVLAFYAGLFVGVGIVALLWALLS
jgi:capsular polysaccharide biosynthesis protein